MFYNARYYSPMMGMFVMQAGMLTTWNIQSRTAESVLSFSSRTQSNSLNLYQPANVPTSGGLSSYTLGEQTSPENAAFNGSNTYRPIQYDGAQSVAGLGPIQLGSDWYRGTNSSIRVQQSLWLEMSPENAVGFGAQAVTAWAIRNQGEKWGAAILGAVGGPGVALVAGTVSLVINVASMTRSDSSYTVVNGSGMTPVAPVPTPSIQPRQRTNAEKSINA